MSKYPNLERRNTVGSNNSGSNVKVALSSPTLYLERSPKDSSEHQKRLEEEIAGLSSTSDAHLDSPKSKSFQNRRNTVHGSTAPAVVKKFLSFKRPSNSDADDAPIEIGTKIDRNHVNFVLMYNMLTGIRMGVSRCDAKIKTELTPSDFRAAHKLAFDITGNELLPKAQYDFKFKDYAPFVFKELRACFKMETQVYLNSLTGKYVLSELGSPGKSGCFFYFSHDYQFIIKTIHHTEHKFLRKILESYYEHVRKNPHTLLSRFYGLHRVKLPRGKKIHFVVMSNIFPPNKDIHEIYDLKGSTVGRYVNKEKIKKMTRGVMKDLNWEENHRCIELGPIKRTVFFEQLQKDVELLSSQNIMDYSLLIGIHDISRGNEERIRDATLSFFEPDAEKLKRSRSRNESGNIQVHVDAVREAVGKSDPVALGPTSSKLPEDPSAERMNCIFNSDKGGFLSTNEQNMPTNELYYIGIIDILTPYTFVKKFEHVWKGISNDQKQISSVNPFEYGHRFLNYMYKTVKGHS